MKEILSCRIHPQRRGLADFTIRGFLERGLVTYSVHENLNRLCANNMFFVLGRTVAEAARAVAGTIV